MPDINLETQIEEFIESFSEGILAEKTRTVPLLGRKCVPELMRTFLGYELKLGKKRITCPDMTTARYLRIFAELGLAQVQIPYDPTRTAQLLPGLEKSFRKIKECLIEQSSLTSKLSRDVFHRIRSRLDKLQRPEA